MRFAQSPHDAVLTLRYIILVALYIRDSRMYRDSNLEPWGAQFPNVSYSPNTRRKRWWGKPASRPACQNGGPRGPKVEYLRLQEFRNT
ncbi:hypothetical protein TSAR_013177 [Trichomalopsis sarcophagae]|uniref:Uncharacterized protein n=1 Tax=Trichomalopsis sarcophagae TaxID=543379 RepID=A0A232FJE4_9HYME|nr:hypothetical protein TSAR_013177 [Trichomalopsis sarcophagae]